MTESDTNQNSHSQGEHGAGQGCSDPSQIGELLASVIEEVFEAIPECTMRPTDIARRIGISRTMVSRTVSAIKKENAILTLTSMPGPESLRSMMHAARIAGVAVEHVRIAIAAIDSFDTMIREQYGTRAAFNAALSVDQESSREKFEQASRYQMYKGMSQMLGVCSKAWLTCSVNTPNKEDPSKLDLSTVLGSSGLRRLRPDIPLMVSMKDVPQHWRRNFPGRREYDIRKYCQYPQAPITPIEFNGEVLKSFVPDVGSKDSIYDHLTATFSPKAQERHLDPKINRRGISIIPDIPVEVLNLDYIVHEDVYPGLTPELFVYNTNGTGKVRVLDPNWSLNRLATSDTVEFLGTGLKNLDLPDMPGYSDMIQYICSQTGYEPNVLRTYRVRIRYPLHGTQYMLAFKLHEKSDPD